ncbi:PspC domain-containing protein [Haloechinothrix sp. LS1_15]|uniref:PspC domain-containing protein n=1 Tax=Haloechinothrix sp. LS1_15 TaxID=2652248 RepID=UPI002947B789|nr:PspC domain-containing protein [Haloechinothrix sp. LS1_15]MDV6013045.1 PspC domain-containing protein [Haloechinothrix sp. LS1_15]
MDAARHTAETGPGGSGGGNGIEDTLRDFWVSRPRRPRRGRMIAGVAVAIGNRYAIDPVIVRVALVVTALIGGAGLLAYLLGWLLFPEEGDEVSAVESLLGRGRSSTSGTLTVLLCVALLPVAGGTIGGAPFHGGGFLGVVLLGAGLYLLHRNRGHENRPVVPPPASTGHPDSAAPDEHAAQRQSPASDSPHACDPSRAQTSHPAAAPATAAGDGASGETTDTDTGQAAHTAWDPLGASPFGWEFAEQNAVAEGVGPHAPRRRSRVGVVTAALALLTAGVATALHLAGLAPLSVHQIVGLTLAVVGFGLVLASMAGSGRGLIALAVPLAVAGLLVTAVPLPEMPRGGWGTIHATPSSAEDVRAEYRRTAGDITLDLTGVAGDEPLRSSLRNTLGGATVIVPEDAEVSFRCASAAGNVDCFTQRREGIGNDVSGVDRPDGEEVRQRITLDLRTVLGSVEVRRG